MTVKVHLQREAVTILRKMADEAGVGLHDMVEIGAYNLVALWVHEHGDTVPLDADDGLAGLR